MNNMRKIYAVLLAAAVAFSGCAAENQADNAVVAEEIETVVSQEPVVWYKKRSNQIAAGVIAAAVVTYAVAVRMGKMSSPYALFAALFCSRVAEKAIAESSQKKDAVKPHNPQTPSTPAETHKPEQKESHPQNNQPSQQQPQEPQHEQHGANHGSAHESHEPKAQHPAHHANMDNALEQNNDAHKDTDLVQQEAKPAKLLDSVMNIMSPVKNFAAHLAKGITHNNHYSV